MHPSNMMLTSGFLFLEECNSPLPSFKALDNGALRPHISYAFLKRMYGKIPLEGTNIMCTDGKHYTVVLEIDPANDDSKNHSMIASFQGWKDGRRFVIIRLYESTVK